VGVISFWGMLYSGHLSSAAHVFCATVTMDDRVPYTNSCKVFGLKMLVLCALVEKGEGFVNTAGTRYSGHGCSRLVV